METSELRKLAEEKLNEKVQFKVNDGGVNLPLMLNAIIDAMLSFHEQASRDMFTTDDMLGFAEYCRLTEVLPTYDNLDIWLAI